MAGSLMEGDIEHRRRQHQPATFSVTSIPGLTSIDAFAPIRWTDFRYRKVINSYKSPVFMKFSGIPYDFLIWAELFWWRWTAPSCCASHRA
jgi:hypothetical protein